MIGLVWETEWRLAFTRRRLFLLNVGVPLLLVVPIAASPAPAAHAAAIYAVLFVVQGTFGSAIPLVRDSEKGMLARILRSGIRPSGYLLARSAAGSLLDWLQLLPSVLVASWDLHGGGSGSAAVLVALAAALWIANVWGTLVATVARSMAEAALFAAVTALLLLHASGVFRAGAPGSLAARVEAASPFRALHEVLLGSGSGSTGVSIAVTLAWCIGLAGLLLLVGRFVGRSLAGTALR